MSFTVCLKVTFTLLLQKATATAVQIFIFKTKYGNRVIFWLVIVKQLFSDFGFLTLRWISVGRHLYGPLNLFFLLQYKTSTKTDNMFLVFWFLYTKTKTKKHPFFSVPCLDVPLKWNENQTASRYTDPLLPLRYYPTFSSAPNKRLILLKAGLPFFPLDPPAPWQRHLSLFWQFKMVRCKRQRSARETGGGVSVFGWGKGLPLSVVFIRWMEVIMFVLPSKKGGLKNMSLTQHKELVLMQSFLL